jgi:mRNA interferase RelE/StbE
VDRKIQALAEDPRPRGSIKMTGVGNAYRIRIGDWRIIYEIDDTAQTVVVTVVAHRREAYR